MSRVVLVTGGGGMLGTALLGRFAISQGDWVVHAPPRRELDLLDAEAVGTWFQRYQPAAVVHVAGHVRGLAQNMSQQMTAFQANARMALNVLDACAATPPERLVVAGSNAAYGHPYVSLPLREDDLMSGDVHAGEYGYAWGQRVLIAGAHVLRDEAGVDARVALLTNMFGPGDRFADPGAHVVPALIRRCVEAAESGAEEVVVWGRPDTTRDFLYAEDAAAIITALLDDPVGSELVNAASGEERTMEEVVGVIARATGFEGRITWDAEKPVGIPRRSVDIVRLKGLGLPAPIGFDEGIRRAVEWYREARPS